MSQVRSGEFRKKHWGIACGAAVGLAAALGAGQAYGLVVTGADGGSMGSGYPSNSVGTGTEGGFSSLAVEGWNYVGQAGVASVVYLGNGWVATAEHVVGDVSSVKFYTDTALASPSQVVSTTLIGGSAVQVINPANLGSGPADPLYQYNNSGVDLAIFKVSGWNSLTLANGATNPLKNLASVKFYTPTGGPSLGTPTSTPVTMIGMGGVAGPLDDWSINKATTPWTWTPLPSSSGANEAGIGITTPAVGPVKVWGTNTTTAWAGPNNDELVNTGYGVSAAIRTDFYVAGSTSPSVIADHASLASGDSGGGTFMNVITSPAGSPDTPTLVGINLGTTPADTWMTQAGGNVATVNVPTTSGGVPSASPFGTVSEAVDATFYEQQIIQATTEWSGATTGTWSSTTGVSTPVNWSFGWTVPGSNNVLYPYFKVPNGVGASAQFLDKITAATTVTITSTVELGVLTFNNANVVTLTGASGKIDFDNGDSNGQNTVLPATISSSGAKHVVGVALMLDSVLNVSVTDNWLTLSGNITNGAAAHGMKALGSGKLVLSGNNTFSGGFTLDSSTGAGTVVAASSTALGSGPVTLLGPSFGSGTVGVLDLASDVSASAYNITVTGSTTGISAANIVADKATAASAGIIHNLGTLTLQGSAGVVLSFSGGNNVASGTAGLAFGATTLAGPTTFSLTNPVAGGKLLLSLGAVTNGANSMTIEGNGSFAQSGAIAGGSGKLVLDPTFSGTATLNQANLYTGGTVLNAGTLAIDSNSALGTGRLTINGGTLDNSGAGTVTLGNVAETWAADIVYTGTGGNTLNLGTGAVTLGANRTVTVNGGTLGVGGTISGSYSLNKQGAGALTLSGANNFTGGITVSSGKLVIGNLAALGSGTLALTAGTAQLQPGLTSGAGAPLVLSHLTMTGGKLDITNNVAVIKSSTDISSTIQSLVKTGKLVTTYGYRDGGGTSGPVTSLGYLTGAAYTAFNGNTLTGYAGSLASNDVVLQWTYPGDITLNGYVDSSDYLLLDVGYLGGFDGVNRVASWVNGDFNGDGVVNALDFQLADASLEQEGNTSLASEMIALHAQMFGANYASGVPEPGSLALLGLGAAGLLRRRRK